MLIGKSDILGAQQNIYQLNKLMDVIFSEKFQSREHGMNAHIKHTYWAQLSSVLPHMLLDLVFAKTNTRFIDGTEIQRRVQPLSHADSVLELELECCPLTPSLGF